MEANILITIGYLSLYRIDFFELLVATVNSGLNRTGDLCHAFPDHAHAADRNSQLGRLIAHLSLSI
jgi:hypothetical protein